MRNNIIYLVSNTANEMNKGTNIGSAVFIELIATIIISVFVLSPLSTIINKNKKNQIFARLFVLRVIILIICNYVFGPVTAIVDFLAIFLGAFILVPFLRACKLFYTKGEETYYEFNEAPETDLLNIGIKD
jgi:O-antigen/teichoic acid export membrane protein